ncbi:MAG: sugar transferase [Phycisphaerales bacterium]
MARWRSASIEHGECGGSPAPEARIVAWSPRFGLVRRLGFAQRSGYWWRRKVAMAIIATISLPYIAWTAALEPLSAIVVGLAFVAWTFAVAHTRTLRGWSARLPAEAVADLLRIGLPITIGSAATLVWLDRPLAGPMALQVLIGGSLILQALFLRGQSATWIRIVGSPSSLGAAVETFDQCMDLFGRDGCRFALFRADRPDPDAWERRMRGWLQRGETILVLEPRLRDLAARMRSVGDVIVAEDCLLFTPMSRPAGPVMNAVLGMFNQALALFAAALLWPLALVIAICIRLDDGGPVIFTQDRVGKDGRVFRLFKFRSMRVDADRYAVHPNGDDPRITRVGRWLRKYSLDELPQVLNVLLGHMRLVGPRPEMPFIVARYTDTHRKRLTVTPGITGLWQVSPHRNDPIHEHIEYDLAYIAHRGPILDLALIISTFGLANSSGN